MYLQSCFFTDRNRYDDIDIIIKNLPKKSIIIFREYDLNYEKRFILAKKIQKIAKKYYHKFLIGKSFEMALELGVDGYHFSDNDKLSSKIIDKIKNRKKMPKKFIFSFACHNFLSILQSNKLKFDMIFISPIFPTKSHKDAKNLGLMGLAKIKKIAKNNLYALGGINKNNLESLKKLDIQGFGAIDYFVN